MPWRCLTAIRSQRGRRDRCLARINHARNQSLQRIATYEQVNGTVGAVFGISHHRLLDQLNSLAHGGKGRLGGSQGARRLPAVRDLAVRRNLRLEDFKHALFEAIPLCEEQLAQVVRARRIGIRANIFGEALAGAVHLEPIKERIAAQPVARL